MGKESYRQTVIDRVSSHGLNVVHPFEAYPYERFEGNPRVGRELAMRYCCKLIDICEDGMAVSGISEGTLTETEYFLTYFPDRNLYLFSELDPEWQTRIEQFREDPRFASAVGKLAVPENLPINSEEH